jgi:RNA polymerase sigma factor (sigma-70 family)
MSDAPLAVILRQLHNLTTLRLADSETDRDLLRRFAGEHDRQAFETLVRRHGPLVLGICRRVLHHEQDAEDAFQATFLVLARKAESIRDTGAVVSWLYGVAQRTALAAKRAANRRQVHEAYAQAKTSPDPSWEVAWREVQTVLDDEIGRLPDRLRGPFLLCHLEGQTRAEAARELGLPEGTVWSRLVHARKLLRGRLARRGITLSAVLGAAGITGSAGAITLSAGLLNSTMRAAEGRAADVSATVTALAEKSIGKTLIGLKLALVLLAAGLFAVGAAVMALSTPAPDPAAKVEPAEKQKPEQADDRRKDRHGDLLPPDALVRMGTIRLRHKEGGRWAAFMPESRQLVTAADDGWVRFWEMAGGKELLSIRAAEHNVSALAITPDGKTLATADGKAIRLWDTKTGRELHKIPFENAGNALIVFTADGATFVTVAGDGSIRLFQTATGKELAKVPTQLKNVSCLAFSADSKKLVIIDGEASAETLRIWDLSSGRQTREVALKSPGDIRIRSLALAPDGRTLAVECATLERVKNAGGGMTVFTQYRLCLWDVAEGRERLRTEGERDVLWAAGFSADGKSVVTAGMGNHVRVWDATTGQLRAKLESYPGGSRPDALGTVAFSPDGKRVATVGEGATAHVWDVDTGKEAAGLPEGHQAAVGALAYSPDGKTLASASEDHTIRLWDAATGRSQRMLKGHQSVVRSLTYAPDGRTLASAEMDGVIRVWDTASGKELRKIQAVERSAGFYSGLCPLAFTPDGKSLASWGDDRCFRLWDLATGKEIRGRPLVLSGLPPVPAKRPEEMPAQDVQVQDVRFNSDGRTAAVAVGGSVYLVDVVTGQEHFKLPGQHGPCRLAFSPDGRTLALGGWDKKVRVWDTITGQELMKAEGLDFINALAIPPNGRTVAAATGWANGEVRLLDIRTGESLLRLRGHESYASALAFSPDGKTVASGQRDTTALVWDLSPGLRRLGALAPELSDKELQSWWEQLAGTDVKKGRAAVEALAAAPKSSLPFLKSRLRPVERAKSEHIQGLIADLDSAKHAVREAAMKELAALGVEAESALRRALKDTLSTDARRRMQALLEGPPPRPIPAGELLRRLRAIHVLEQIGSTEAASILKELAEGAPSAHETQEARTASERLSHRTSRQ